METQFKPIDIKRASKLVAERLRERILYGDLRHETRLAAEQELADQLGISRHHLREALRLLEQDGLIEVKRGYTGGVFLTSPRADVLARATEGILARNDVLVIDVLEAARVVIAACIRMAVDKASDDEIAAFKTEVSAQPVTISLSESMSHFRRSVAKMSKNQTMYLLLLALEPLLTHIERTIDQSVGDHRKGTLSVVKALVNRDADLAVGRMDRYTKGADDQLRRLGFDPHEHTITDSFVRT